MVMATSETGIQRTQPERDKEHQAPHRHAQAEELPIDRAAIAGGQQDLACRTQHGTLLDEEVQARAAARHRRRIQLHPGMAARIAGAHCRRDEREQRPGLASARRTRRMQATEQEYEAERGEGDALEDAERTRLDAELELHVERIAEQRGADGESEQELTAERPVERIHAHALRGGPPIIVQTPGNEKPRKSRGLSMQPVAPEITRRRPAGDPPARRTPSAHCRRRGSRTSGCAGNHPDAARSAGPAR